MKQIKIIYLDGDDMEERIIGIGDIAVEDEKDTCIKTYALGSCVALILYDTITKTGAMAHVALPDSAIDKKRAITKPGYFGDTALPALIKKLKAKNIAVTSSNIKVIVTGGASMLNKSSFFNIGKKNVESVKNSIKEHRLKITKEETGSTISRTATLDIDTGKVILFNPTKGVWEL